MGYIYSIKNKINGKKYIGQTIEKDVNDRWRSHLKSNSNCVYLKRAFKKYAPENFKFEIICICFDNDCNTYEKEYIKKFNTIVPNGYNLKQGGNNGGKHHSQTKKKISETLKITFSKRTDEQKKIDSERFLGEKNSQYKCNLTQEYIDKKSKIMKEKWKSGFFSKVHEKTKKKVDCFSLDNVFIARYESLSEAGRQLICSKSLISRCCNNKNKNYKGFIWQFVN
jgi:group I intron endonuclease